jgi:RHH-type transcriptional regulator, rel operon repressor / antitoxin RelB
MRLSPYVYIIFEGTMAVKAKAKDTEILTVRLDRESKIALTELAESMDRSKSYLASEAVREFIDVRRWQIAEIRAGIKEANAEKFADSGKVDDFLKKWGAL